MSFIVRHVDIEANIRVMIITGFVDNFLIVLRYARGPKPIKNCLNEPYIVSAGWGFWKAYLDCPIESLIKL